MSTDLRGIKLTAHLRSTLLDDIFFKWLNREILTDSKLRPTKWLAVI
jgi:hypothetical protein